MQAGGEGDEPLGMGGQHLQIDARLVVEPFQLGQAGQLDQVLVAGVVHGQEHEVEGGLARAFRGLVEAVAGGDIELAADDGLDPGLFGLDVEFQGAEHGAVVGDGHGAHPVFLALGQQVADPDGAVEQAVLGVDMEVDEIGWRGFRHG